VISALAAPDCIHRKCLSRAVTHVCVLTAPLYAFCLLLLLGYTLAVSDDGGSNWEWLRDYLSASTMRCDIIIIM